MDGAALTGAAVRDAVDRIADALRVLREELPALGWRFDDPDGVLPGPDPGAAKALDAFEREVGPVPLALRAFATRVGPVSLLGHHPGWAAEHPDAIVVLPFWSQLLEEHAQHRAWGTFDEPGSDGRFPLALSPDALHKSGVSGGPAYAVAVPDPIADPPWLEDPAHPGTTFLGYLRASLLDAAGLPGLRRPDGTMPPELAEVAARLPRP